MSSERKQGISEKSYTTYRLGGMIFVEEWNLELRKNESIAHYETLDRMRRLNFYL
jgi:hypothetical protein